MASHPPSRSRPLDPSGPVPPETPGAAGHGTAAREPTGATIEPPRRSSWSLRERLGRALWSITWYGLWSRTPRSWHGVRRQILRWFGAAVGPAVRIDPTVRIEVPWHLRLGAGSCIGPRAILYCLGMVEVGEASLVGPYVHVCAGTHDMSDPRFTLLRSPIRIGRRCVLMTASFIGPGVTLGDGIILRERGGIFRTIVEPGQYEGSPAKPVRDGSGR